MNALTDKKTDFKTLDLKTLGLLALGLVLASAAAAEAGTGGGAFQGLYTYFVGLADGYVGRFLALLGLMFGLFMGLIRGSLMGAGGGFLVAVAMSFGPAIIDQTITATLPI